MALVLLGCTGAPLPGRESVPPRIQAELRAARQQARQTAEQLAKSLARVERLRLLVAARSRALDAVHGRLAAATQHAARAREAARLELARKQSRCLTQCQPLPTSRTLLRALRRPQRGRVKILSRLRTPGFLAGVATVSRRGQGPELQAFYQSKLMRGPTVVVVARIQDNRWAPSAAVTTLLDRYLHVRSAHRERVRDGSEVVREMHYILRIGDQGLELACTARGSTKRRTRKGVEFFSRVVRVLPPRQQDRDQLRVRVLVGRTPASLVQSNVPIRGAKTWLMVLGDKGPCTATLVGSARPRSPMEGLY